MAIFNHRFSSEGLVHTFTAMLIKPLSSMLPSLPLDGAMSQCPYPFVFGINYLSSFSLPLIPSSTLQNFKVLRNVSHVLVKKQESQIQILQGASQVMHTGPREKNKNTSLVRPAAADLTSVAGVWQTRKHRPLQLTAAIQIQCVRPSRFPKEARNLEFYIKHFH